MMTRKIVLLVWVLFLLAVLPSAFAQESPLAAERNALLSKLQSMGHGYYTEAEWQELMAQVQSVTEKAQKAGAWNDLVELNIIKAMVYSDMLGDHGRALKILEEARQQYGKMEVAAMPRLYVREAEVYSKLGDEDAIRQLIKDFKASPYYDPEAYGYSGGQGRDVPLVVTRPDARGSDSITVTSMEKFRRQARFAAGRLFPEFEAVDMSGRPVRLSDYRGKVLLLDFWAEHWAPWRSNLATLRNVYRQYRDQGFELVGVYLPRDASGLPALLKANGMTWPQIADQGEVARKLGLFGEACNFLVDGNGMIIGRDLQEANLNSAIRQALGYP